jgi:hypothetical protein
MNANLSPRPEEFEQLLKLARAVVLVRYFGFEGETKSLAGMAADQGCLVIEDLAHAPFINELYSDFAVTSLPKFFPVTSGAEIWVAEGRRPDAVQRALTSHRQNPLRWQINLLLHKLRRRIHSPAAGDQAGALVYFQEPWLGKPASRKEMEEIARHDESEIIAARRSNYQRLDERLKNSSMGRSLYPGLGPGDTPYVYPFVLGDSAGFDRARNAGIPLFRWEELAPSTCETSRDYRSKLIQVPCHQDLSADNLDLIEATLS